MAAAPALTRAASSGWRRLTGPRRIAGVDLARGLAVIGMFGAHLLVTDIRFDWADPSSWTDIVNGRSSILFATLAGVSIALMTGGARPVTGRALADARIRLAARAVILLTLGLLLVMTAVPVFVILPAYAILFVLALPFLTLRASALFGLAAALALVMPWVQVLLDDLPVWSSRYGAELSTALGWHYPFPVWIAFVLAGMGLGRLDLRAVRVQVAAVATGAALAMAGYGAAVLSGVDAASEDRSYLDALWTARAHSSGLLEVIGSGGFAIAVIGACLLVCQSVLRWVVLPLRAVGSMPLTAYTAQLVAWVIVAWLVLPDIRDLGGFRDFDPFWPMTLWTVAGCTVWALAVGRGPLEWLTDRFSAAVVDASRADRLSR